MITRALDLGSDVLQGLENLAADGRRACNFLRERHLFQPRRDDVYVVSYPRSGTTILQFMAYLMVGRRDLDFAHIGQVAPWFERSLAIGAAHARDFESLPGRRVFKSHLTPEWLPAAGRRIYVWRDGRDVALSYFHLYRSHLGFQGNFPEFFQRFMRGDVQYRGWAGHVRRWQDLAAQKGDVLLVRFEEIEKDRGAVVDRMAAFLDVTLSDERRAEIVALTDFQSMKARQAQFDHTTALLLERGLKQDGFIREGKVGQGATMIDPAQQEALNQALIDAKPPSRQWRLADFLH